MIIAVLVGILDGVPDGHGVRMQYHIGLTTKRRIPEEGIALTVDAGRTANHMPLVFGNKKPTTVGFCCFFKELIVRNISLWLKPMVLVQQLTESLEVFFAFHLAGDDSAGIGIVDALLHLLRDALFGQTTVK